MSCSGNDIPGNGSKDGPPGGRKIKPEPKSRDSNLNMALKIESVDPSIHDNISSSGSCDGRPGSGAGRVSVPPGGVSSPNTSYQVSVASTSSSGVTVTTTTLRSVKSASRGSPGAVVRDAEKRKSVGEGGSEQGTPRQRNKSDSAVTSVMGAPREAAGPGFVQPAGDRPPYNPGQPLPFPPPDTTEYQVFDDPNLACFEERRLMHYYVRSARDARAAQARGRSEEAMELETDSETEGEQSDSNQVEGNQEVDELVENSVSLIVLDSDSEHGGLGDSISVIECDTSSVTIDDPPAISAEVVTSTAADISSIVSDAGTADPEDDLLVTRVQPPHRAQEPEHKPRIQQAKMATPAVPISNDDTGEVQTEQLSPSPAEPLRPSTSAGLSHTTHICSDADTLVDQDTDLEPQSHAREPIDSARGSVEPAAINTATFDSDYLDPSLTVTVVGDTTAEEEVGFEPIASTSIAPDLTSSEPAGTVPVKSEPVDDWTEDSISNRQLMPILDFIDLVSSSESESESESECEIEEKYIPEDSDHIGDDVSPPHPREMEVLSPASETEPEEEEVAVEQPDDSEVQEIAETETIDTEENNYDQEISSTQELAEFVCSSDEEESGEEHDNEAEVCKEEVTTESERLGALRVENQTSVESSITTAIRHMGADSDTAESVDESVTETETVLADTAAPPPAEFSVDRDCPICAGDAQVTDLTSDNLRKLKRHVEAAHFPWYISVCSYNKGENRHQTALSHRLHPVISLSLKERRPLSRALLTCWGRLLQGLLSQIRSLLDLTDRKELLDFVDSNKLYPEPNQVDVEQAMAFDNQLLISAHCTSISSNPKWNDVRFSPPSHVTSLLHWITMTNLICCLTSEEQERMAKFEKYKHDELYQRTRHLNLDGLDKKEKAEKFWRYLEEEKLTPALEIMSRDPNVYHTYKTGTDYKPLNYVMAERRYEAAVALLLVQIYADERDREGSTVLCNAAKRGDLTGVQLLLAWGARGATKTPDVAKTDVIRNIILANRSSKSPKKGTPRKEKRREEKDDEANAEKTKERESESRTENETGEEAPVRSISRLSDDCDGPMLDCKLCYRFHRSEEDCKKHFLSFHLPWYFRVYMVDEDVINPEASDVQAKLQPALNDFLFASPVVPLVTYFAKLWGCLLHHFLERLCDLLGFATPIHMLKSVNKSLSRRDFNPIQASDVIEGYDETLMEAHQSFTAGRRVTLSLDPPTCPSTLLYWKILMIQLARLDNTTLDQLYEFEAYTELEDLMTYMESLNKNPTVLGHITGNMAFIKAPFIKAYRKDDASQMEEMLANYKSLATDREEQGDFVNHLQYCVARKKFRAAHLLLFHGSSACEPDRTELSPLTRAARDGSLKGVKLLIPWANRKDVKLALAGAKKNGHKKVGELLQGGFQAKMLVSPQKKSFGKPESGPVRKRPIHDKRTPVKSRSKHKPSSRRTLRIDMTSPEEEYPDIRSPVYEGVQRKAVDKSNKRRSIDDVMTPVVSIQRIRDSRDVPSNPDVHRNRGLGEVPRRHSREDAASSKTSSHGNRNQELGKQGMIHVRSSSGSRERRQSGNKSKAQVSTKKPSATVTLATQDNRDSVEWTSSTAISNKFSVPKKRISHLTPKTKDTPSERPSASAGTSNSTLQSTPLATSDDTSLGMPHASHYTPREVNIPTGLVSRHTTLSTSLPCPQSPTISSSSSAAAKPPSQPSEQPPVDMRIDEISAVPTMDVGALLPALGGLPPAGATSAGRTSVTSVGMKPPAASSMVDQIDAAPCDNQPEIGREEPIPQARERATTLSATDMSVCPICKYSGDGDVTKTKFHVFAQHLPWYFSLHFRKECRFPAEASTNLCGQLAPLMVKCQNQLVYKIVARLLQDFGDELASCLPGTSGLIELSNYVIEHKRYPRTEPELSNDERYVIECHMNLTISAKDYQLSPPSHVSAIFHWWTMAKVMSRVEKVHLPRLRTFEKHKANRILASLGLSTNFPRMTDYRQTERDLDAVFKEGNVEKLWTILKADPSAAQVCFGDKRRTPALGYPVSGTKYDQATLMLLYGASPDQKNAQKKTIFYNFVAAGNVEGVRFLLRWAPKNQLQECVDAAALKHYVRIHHMILKKYPDLTPKLSLDMTSDRDGGDTPGSTGGRTPASPRSTPGASPNSAVGTHNDLSPARHARSLDVSTEQDFASRLPRDPRRVSLERRQGHLFSPDSGHGSPLDISPHLGSPGHAEVTKVKCTICHEHVTVSSYRKHVGIRHLPWYVAVTCVDIDDDCRDLKRTRMSSMLCESLHYFVVNEKRPPKSIAQVWGKLLYGFMTCLETSLNLCGEGKLLEHVAEKQLWKSPAGQADVVWERQGLLGLIYQAYTETTGNELNYFPPDSDEGLLHCRTLCNIISKLPSDWQRKCQLSEEFCWDRNKPVIPYVTGDVIQPRVGKFIPPMVHEEFFTCMKEADVAKLEELLQEYPNFVLESTCNSRKGMLLLQLCETERQCSIVAQVLMLHGAPANQRDLSGETALHRAVRSNYVLLVRLLLAWGVESWAKNPAGLSPHDLAITSQNKQLEEEFEDRIKAEDMYVDERKSKERDRCVSLTCPVCQKICLNLANLEEHVCTLHLPWYLALRYHTDIDKLPTVLAKQLMPVIGKICGADPLPLHDRFQFCLGRLINGFLVKCQKILDLESVQSLLLLVEEKKLYPTSSVDYENLPKHQAILIRSNWYAMYMGHDRKERTKFTPVISPPNCVPALLHWYTLANILSLLPANAWPHMRTYERYSSGNILVAANVTENDFTSSVTSVKLLDLVDAIDKNNQNKAFRILNKHPAVVTEQLDDKTRSTPLHVAIRKQNLDMATHILLTKNVVDLENRNNHTALYVAAMEGHLEEIKFLINWGATIQVAEVNTISAIGGNTRVCEFLHYYYNSVLQFPEAMNRNDQGSFPMTRNRHDLVTSCGLCLPSRGILDLKQHVLERHMPWYLSVSLRPPDLLQPHTTKLACQLGSSIHSRVMRDVEIPAAMMRILGCLVDGYLKLLAKKLGLASAGCLLRLAKLQGEELYPDRVSSEDFDITLPGKALQRYWGVRKKITFSPPQSLAGILHWRTLYNILLRVTPLDREELLIHESYAWDKESPWLPSLKGMVTQPYIRELSQNEVPDAEAFKFREAIRDADVMKASSLLQNHPGLVWEKFSLARVGAVTCTLKTSQTLESRLETAKLLLLSGASIDAVDENGYSALHHAALKQEMEEVKFLLLWDADKGLTNRKRHGILNFITRAEKELEHVSPRKATPAASPDNRRGEKRKSLEPSPETSQSKRVRLEHDTCPVCQSSQGAELREHVLREHLPWYVSFHASTLHLIEGARELKLARVAKRFPELHQLPCFKQFLANLLDNLLGHISSHLGLQVKEELLTYIKQQEHNSLLKYNGSNSNSEENQMVQMYRARTQKPGGSLGTIATPVCVSGLLHWKWLSFLISRLPAASCLSIRTMERKTIPVFIKPEIASHDKSWRPSNVREVQGKIDISDIPALCRIFRRNPELPHEDVSLTDSDVMPLNVTLMTYALRHKRYPAMVVLYLYGTDVNKKDDIGMTSLQHAAVIGDVTGTQLLLDLGARVKDTTPVGSTALELAKQRQHTGVVNLLSSRRSRKTFSQ